MPFFCMKKLIKQIISLEWSDCMTKELKIKRLIVLLTLGLILLASMIFLREETSDKSVPKKATLVYKDVTRCESYE